MLHNMKRWRVLSAVLCAWVFLFGLLGRSGVGASKEKGFTGGLIKAEGLDITVKVKGGGWSECKKSVEGSGRRRLLTKECAGEKLEIDVAEPVGNVPKKE